MKKKILAICVILAGVIALAVVGPKYVRRWKDIRWGEELLRSEAIAAKAVELLNSGDTITARLVALHAMPKNLDRSDAPFAMAAEKVLRVTSAKEGVILNGHTDRVNSVVFSSDDSHLVSASDDNTVCLWRAEDYVLVQRCSGHRGRVLYAAISSDGKYVVSYSNDDRSIIVWDVADGRIYRKIDVGSEIKGLCVGNSGHGIAYSTAGNDIIVTDIDADAQAPRVLKGHESDVHALEFNYNDKYLLSASTDNTFRIWNLETGEESIKVDTDYGRVSSFCLDGYDVRYLAIDGGELTFAIGVMGMDLTGGHTGRINYAAFSPDIHCAVSVSDDESVVVWKLLEGGRYHLDVLMRYDGHSAGVNHAAFSHDGTRIVSASDDCTVRVWEFPPLQELVDLTEIETADRKLTREELEKYCIK